MCRNIKTLKSLLVKAQKGYIIAKAENETVKQIEEESKVKVLKENIFLTADHEEAGEEQQRILKSNGDYHMNDEDFTKYCKLCLIEYLKNGLDVPDFNTTPDYLTRKTLMIAEEKLLNVGIEVIVKNKDARREDLEKIKDHYEARKTMIELTLSLDL